VTGISTVSPTVRCRELDLLGQDVAALAVHADQVARLGGPFAVEDPRREALAVERVLEVVGHAAVDGHMRARAALDGDHAVERHAGAADDGAPGLDDQARARVELLQGADRRVGVVGDRRRFSSGR
jgi:hypothetical protein